ncbi:hypothetical protein [Chitinophaga sp. HK235]|uniref:hypothetical protein n=1 Tax=Chitinophaga sp. HK235 TaxID=2952571 RepID=UPI001BAA828C|nr:hypothetical protein [Chitinophaga sp. HK235]
MTRTYLFLSAFLAVMAVSCSKEPMAGPDPDPETTPTTPTSPSGSNKLTGVWKYAGMKINGQTVSESNIEGQAMRGIIDMDYTTFNNSGTVTFEETTVASNNIGYSLDTKVRVRAYIDGVLFRDMNESWPLTIPPMSSNGKYNMIGTDSVRIEGVVSSVPSSTGQLSKSIPATYKIAWAGDTLVLRAHIIFSSSEEHDGITAVSHNDLYQELKLARK